MQKNTSKCLVYNINKNVFDHQQIDLTEKPIWSACYLIIP